MNHTIELKKVPQPKKDHSQESIFLSNQTMELRKEKVLQSMKKNGLDKLVIYADVEHGMNFEYLVGFFPRFEEALLVLDQEGTAYLLMGNENLNKATKARIVNTAIHVPYFSLPNQPMNTSKTMKELLQKAELKEDDQVGIIGWKLFSDLPNQVEEYFDVPSFIVDAIKAIVKNKGQVHNAIALMIGEQGARIACNANEIAHYEYGASLASDAMLDAMNVLDIGVKELTIGDTLSKDGQHHNVVSIAASGQRYINGNMFPSDHCVELQDAISLTVGYVGGLSSRAGYAVQESSQLPHGAKDYLTRLAIPYHNVYVTWLERIHVGMCGGDMFDLIEKTFPRKDYHWSLCPGHLVAEEERMCSPIYENSKEVLKSGMILQVDIIPSLAGYAGVCAESTIALANAELRDEIKCEYPKLWDRIIERRAYMETHLGIVLSEEVLPLCSSVAYLRPFLLAKDKAFVVDR